MQWQLLAAILIYNYFKFGFRLFINSEIKKIAVLVKKGYFVPLFDQKLLFLPLKLAIYGLKANSRIDQNHQ